MSCLDAVLVCVVFMLFNLYCITCDEEVVLEKYTRKLSINEFILCRGCGVDVTDSHDLIQISSPQSLAASNRTLFKKESVLIQVLSNTYSSRFVLITSDKASCEGFGEWQWEDSWFPGYLWRPCICPECGAQIGWVYEPMNSILHKSFYGLILSQVVGESCNYFTFLKAFGQVCYRFLTRTPYKESNIMATTADLTASELEFLNKCEEELKDRYTEKDEEFMKVFNAEPSVPPIIDPWDQNRLTRNRNRRFNPYRNRRDYNNHSNDRGNFESDRRENYNRRDNDSRYNNRRDGYRSRYNRRDDYHSNHDRRDNYELGDNSKGNYGSPSNRKYDEPGNSRNDN